jgi:hypothetical protein
MKISLTSEMAHKAPSKSKLLVIKAICVSILLFFISASGFSQSFPTATVNSNGILQLPTTDALATTYTFDLSFLTFSSEEAMTDFLRVRCTEDIVFRAFTSENKGIVSLQRKKHPNWTVADWNAALQSALANQPLLNN